MSDVAYPGTVIIRRTKMIVVLTEQEVLDMLEAHPNKMADALRRGKGISRVEKSMERKPKGGSQYEKL